MANAMQQWQAKAAETLAIANALVNRLPELERLYLANDLAAAVTATADGEVVTGGNMTKERLLELEVMFDAFNTWLNTPLSEALPAPVVIVSRVD